MSTTPSGPRDPSGPDTLGTPGEAAFTGSAVVGAGAFLALATWSQTGSSIVQQGIAVLAVFIRAQHNLSLSEMGLLTSATSVGVVLGFLTAGPQVDRRGPRTVLMVGTVWAALAAAFLAVSHLIAFVALGLVLLGYGMAAYPSSGTRAVFDAFPRRRRGLMMGIRQSGVVLGSALAAASLPALAIAYGLNRVFVLESVILLAAGLPFVWVMHHRSVRRVTVSGRASWRELHGALAPFLAASLLVSAQYCPLAFVMTDLHAVHHWTWTAAGAGLAVMQVGGGLGRVGFGWLSDRLGGRRPSWIMGAAGIAAAGAFVLGVWNGGGAAWLMFPLLFVFGTGAVGWNALTLTWAGERVPAQRSGQAMSLTGAVVFLGSAVYPPLFGGLVDATGQFRTAWWALSLLLMVAVTVVGLLARSRDAGVAV